MDGSGIQGAICALLALATGLFNEDHGVLMEHPRQVEPSTLQGLGILIGVNHNQIRVEQ
jgi:hypothetical protein